MSSINFSIGGDNAKFKAVARDTQQVGQRMAANVNKGIGASVNGIGTKLAGLAAGFITVQSALSSFSGALAAGGRLNDLAAKVGATAGQLSIMERAFENAGIGAEKVSPAFAKMNRLIADADGGAKAAQERLQALGFTSSDLLGKLPTEQMGMLADSIARIKDPTLRSSAAMDVFGKSGADMLPLLLAFSGELDRARRQLGSWPAILDKANVDMDTLGENFTNVKEKSMEFAGGILSVVAPALARLSEALAEIDAAGAGKNFAETFTPNGGQKFQVGYLETVANNVSAVGEGMQDLMGGPLGDMAFSGMSKLAGGFRKKASSLRKEFKLDVPIEPVFNGPIDMSGQLKEITDKLPKAGENFALAVKEGAKALAESAASMARATQPGALKLNMPAVPRINSIPDALQPKSQISSWNALQAAPSQFQKLQQTAFGSGTMLGPSRSLSGASLAPSTIAMGMGGAKKGYEGSYGLIRRGDKARRAQEEQSKSEKSGTLQGTNEKLEEIKRVMETAWGST